MAKTDKSFELIPPEGNEKVGKRVFEILSIIVADKVKMGLHERWFRNYQLRRNQHWKAKSPQGVPLVSANLLFTHIQRTVNTMTDNNPTFNIAAVGKIEDQQKDSLSDLQRCTEHWWIDQEQQDVLESSCINGEEYGIAIEKVVFNPDIEYGIGEVETIPVDPFHFGFYPVKLSAARDIQKCEMITHFYPAQVRTLKAKYPDKADKIKPDKELLAELMDDERREMTGQGKSGGGALVSIASAVKELVNFVSGTGQDEEDQETLLCEAWVRDRSRTSEKVDGKDGEVTENSVPTYTGEIRYILCCSGGVVLEDKDNPNINPEMEDDEARKTYLYDKFPFCAVNSVKDTSNAWGTSDYEQLEWLNMEINKSLSQLVLEKDRSARKKLINPKDSGVRNEELTNYPGIISPVSAMAGAGIRWLETPQSSVDFDKAIAMFKDLFMLVSGVFDVDSAQTGGGQVIAYKAIAALLERSATMMRGKIRAYSRLIRERGRMYLSHVMNFYTEERWITYTDEQGQKASKPIKGSDLVMPAKLTVVTGSTMPISRVQQREEALALFAQQAIDQQELLEKLDWSNRSEVIKRMQAGPLGAALQNLQSTGMPPPILEYIQQVGTSDPKDLQKGLDSGEIPPFTEYAQATTQPAGPAQPNTPDPALQAEFEEKMANVKKAMAEIEKIMADRDLINEKAVTERVHQTVQLAGVDYDDQVIKMQRAKLVNEMESGAETRQNEQVNTNRDFALDAHKADQGSQMETRRMDQAAETEKMKFDRAGDAGFNDKKLKSDNQEE